MQHLTHHGILSDPKDQTVDTCSKLADTWGNYSERKMPTPQGYMPMPFTRHALREKASAAEHRSGLPEGLVRGRMGLQRYPEGMWWDCPESWGGSGPRNLFLCLDACNDPLESHFYYMSFKKIKLRKKESEATPSCSTFCHALHCGLPGSSVHGIFQARILAAAAAAAKSLQSCPTLCDPHRRQPARLPCPWDSPGKNTGVGCYFLLQEIFPTQGLNPGLPHCRQMLYHMSHQGSL